MEGNILSQLSSDTPENAEQSASEMPEAPEPVEEAEAPTPDITEGALDATPSTSEGASEATEGTADKTEDSDSAASSPESEGEDTPEQEEGAEPKQHVNEKRRRYNEVADEISTQLGEHAYKPRSQFRRVVRIMGEEWSMALFNETMQIEADGGMMVSSGERRRTPGGVFLHLARERMPLEQSAKVFHTWRNKDITYQQRESSFQPLTWESRAELKDTQIYENTGEVSELQITMTGRPGELERRQEMMVFTMEDEIKETLQLPRGVPHPGQLKMVYTVFASIRQWERVEKLLKKDDEKLIVNGFTAFDDETNSMIIFATELTTKRLKKKDRNQANPQGQSQKEKGDNDKKPAKKAKADKAEKAPKSNTAKSSKSSRSISKEIPESVPVPIEIDLPPGVPPEVAQKLTELYRAAATFQQKIEVLEAKPANEQFGLEMTQKLLKNTQTQIERLEKPYRN